MQLWHVFSSLLLRLLRLRLMLMVKKQQRTTKCRKGQSEKRTLFFSILWSLALQHKSNSKFKKRDEVICIIYFSTMIL